MKKKMQVFISSTYMDLKEERQKAVQIILMNGHIPAGMELFGQDDGERWNVIKNWIDESDVFLIMVKNRYGSICKETNKSYTQMEYEYAVSKQKPIIKLVLNDEVDEEESDNYNKLQAFREDLRFGGVDTTIHNDTEFAHRITSMLSQYEKDFQDGWCRYDEIKKVEMKYDLVNFLMFAEDKGNEGFNRFNVAPKILMLMDKEQKYNDVEIGHLDVCYSIKTGENTKTNVFDCERKWVMRDIRNIGNDMMNHYYFFTATDIGNRQNANVHLIRCVNKRIYELNEFDRNNGISCWSWNVEPHIEHNGLINDMIIDEKIKDAWDLNRVWEIAYFIPKCFGKNIINLSFRFETDENVPILDMSMFEVLMNGKTPERKEVGNLKRESNVDGSHIYGIDLDRYAIGIHMDSFYYIKIKVVR